MAVLTKTELLDKLSQYGYPLLRPSDTQSPEELLKALLQQDDARLMEGFPVVLANAMKKGQLAWEGSDQDLGVDFQAKVNERLVCLLALSFLLYKLFGLEVGYQNRTKRLLEKFRNGKQVLQAVEDPFVKSMPVRADGVVFSTERLKNAFRNYAVQVEDAGKVDKMRYELELELLLSELFTLHQKQLIKKKLAGKALTKTEREYFSRVVMKRLRALACVELHQLASSLVKK